ncbi:PIN domain-containing protein [Arhodomonas sp. SL1]|uniref:PIN domain-containing protein n=1 Tax=Arhodomonas sp. SL1 TaxID=3425691 RepID=UPI003F883B92
MIGLDTKILARYLTQDDPQQAALATEVIEGECSRERPGRIALVVLCELVWVLRGAYRYDKAVVVRVLEELLPSAELAVEAEEVVHQALAAYRDGAADFADYVIAYSNHAAGCALTRTLDRRLATHQYAGYPETD